MKGNDQTKVYDYNNYDYLEIIVKKNSAEEITLWYGRLLWSEIQRREDKRYHDVLHISFSRPHKIPNKDRLQLLQVYYENILNEKAYKFKERHAKSEAIILTTVIMVIVAFLGLGALVYFGRNMLAYVGAGLLLALMGIGLGCISVFIKRLRKRENSVFEKKCVRYARKIDKIMKEISNLTEKNNEKES